MVVGGGVDLCDCRKAHVCVVAGTPTVCVFICVHAADSGLSERGRVSVIDLRPFGK